MAEEETLNIVKMREALESLTQHFCKNCPDNGPYGCESEPGHFEFLCPKLKQARTALSAPPRNCDLYESVDDAWTAFCKDDPPHLMYSPWLDSLVKFRDWLFEEAKELKEEEK